MFWGLRGRGGISCTCQPFYFIRRRTGQRVRWSFESVPFPHSLPWTASHHIGASAVRRHLLDKVVIVFTDRWRFVSYLFLSVWARACLVCVRLCALRSIDIQRLIWDLIFPVLSLDARNFSSISLFYSKERGDYYLKVYVSAIFSWSMDYIYCIWYQRNFCSFLFTNASSHLQTLSIKWTTLSVR